MDESKTMPAGATLDVPRLVAPVRRRMVLALVLRWGLRGIAAALVIGWALELITRIVPWPDGDPLGGYTRWMGLAVFVALAAIGVVVVRRWPGQEQAIRRADGMLQLKDRLTTAHEFRAVDSVLVRLQRSELGALIQSVDLRKAVRVSVPRREAAVAAAAALLLVGTALVPAAHNSALAQAQHRQAVARHAADRVAAVAKQFHRQATSSPDRSRSPQTKQGEAILRQLQSQLAHAKDPAQALKALAQAQQQLQKLAGAGTQAQQALQALRKALASGPTSALSKALASGNSAQTQKALQSLQQGLGKMSPAQRADLARKLEQAANTAPGQLSDQLRQAALNLQDDNLQAAQQSLQGAQQQIQAAQQAAQAGQQAQQTQQSLQDIKQQVANGVTQDQGPQEAGAGQPGTQQPGSGQQGSGAQPGKGSKGQVGQPGQGGRGNGKSGTRGAGQGQGQGTGKGQGYGQGQGQGTGSGQGRGSSPGQGTGSGQGTGAAAGNGQGRGGSGGSGQGGGAGNAGGRNSGSYETVYLPGLKNGGSSVVRQGPLGKAVPVQSGSFRSLLPQYSAAADSSLGRTALPPAMQAAVKRYFQALGQ